MQSCAVSSSVSLMFQKGSGVEKKYLCSELLRGKKSRKKERKENLMQERKVKLYHSVKDLELISGVAAKLCLKESSRV